jgi:hypothetical protein
MVPDPRKRLTADQAFMDAWMQLPVSAITGPVPVISTRAFLQPDDSNIHTGPVTSNPSGVWTITMPVRGQPSQPQSSPQQQPNSTNRIPAPASPWGSAQQLPPHGQGVSGRSNTAIPPSPSFSTANTLTPGMSPRFDPSGTNTPVSAMSPQLDPRGTLSPRFDPRGTLPPRFDPRGTNTPAPVTTPRSSFDHSNGGPGPSNVSRPPPSPHSTSGHPNTPGLRVSQSTSHPQVTVINSRPYAISMTTESNRQGNNTRAPYNGLPQATQSMGTLPSQNNATHHPQQYPMGRSISMSNNAINTSNGANAMSSPAARERDQAYAYEQRMVADINAMKAHADRQRAEADRLRAQANHQRAQADRQVAEADRQRANAERQTAFADHQKEGEYTITSRSRGAISPRRIMDEWEDSSDSSDFSDEFTDSDDGATKHQRARRPRQARQPLIPLAPVAPTAPRPPQSQQWFGNNPFDRANGWPFP